ncbi:MAG: hypothetical protein GY833_16590 [Aestuariibacter sp.]|nr:hypothetical protein [Aestuariibacter sp.]
MNDIITDAQKLFDAATTLVVAFTALVAAATALWAKAAKEVVDFKRALEKDGINKALQNTGMTEAKAKKKKII